MIYTDIEIEKELSEADIQNQVYYVGLLPTFIWDRKSKSVVEYHSTPNRNNDLIVIEAGLIKLEKDLKSYLKSQNINENSVLIFCINSQYFPKDADKNKKEKWIRIKII